MRVLVLQPMSSTQIPYTEPAYLFPPRPTRKIKPSNLSKYEGEKYVLQPKMDGSCAVIFTNGRETIVKNRHRKGFSRFKMDMRELTNVHRGEEGTWMVLIGEYMNKSRRDELGCVWNEKIVIFDILVYESKLLIGMKMDDRLLLLEDLYPDRAFKPYLSKISKNIWRVKNIYDETGFYEKFDKIGKINMYEGFVLKQRDARLRPPYRGGDNSASQLKVRKPTKNYRY